MRRPLHFFLLTLCAGLISFHSAFSQCPATMNPVRNQVVCNGSKSAAVNFGSTVTGVSYKWTNDNPAIGLAASGTGSIGSFTATNNTKAPITATVTVTPSYSYTYAYIPNNGSNTVSVIDVNTGVVIKNINVENGPSGVAASPDGSRVYIVNGNSSSVSVINTTDNTVIANPKVGFGPYSIAVTPDGSKVYVANSGTNTVSVINTATNTVDPTPITVGNNPIGIAVTPDGSRVYVANPNSDNISVIQTKDNKVIATIDFPTASKPGPLVISPDGNKIYVANVQLNTVSVINTATNTVDPISITIGSDPQGIAVTPDGSKVYVANSGTNTVSVINTATNTVDVAPIAVGGNPRGITVSPDGSKVYVANSFSDNISVINTATNAVDPTPITVQDYPIAFGNAMAIVDKCAGPSQTFTLTVSPTADVAAVVNQVVCNGSTTAPVNFTGTVPGTVYKWSNNNPAIGLPSGGIGSIPAFTATNTGSTPLTSTVTVTPYFQKAYAYIPNDVKLSVIDVNTEEVIKTITLGYAASNIIVSPDLSKLYITHLFNGRMSVVNLATDAVTTINLGGNPKGIVTSPKGDRVYVANKTDLLVIDAATNTVLKTLTLGPRAEDVAISPDGAMLYVSHSGSDYISVVNTVTLAVSTVKVGNYPYGIAISPDGTKAYVVNNNVGSVVVLNTSDNTIASTIYVGSEPHNVIISPDGKKIYVDNQGSNSIAVINAVTNEFETYIHVGSRPEGIAITADGSKLYVANQFSNNVSVINTASNTVVSTINMDSQPLFNGNAIATFIKGCDGSSQSFTYTVKPSTVITVTTQPAAQAVCEGAAATFSVAATGSTPLTYQWRKNGSPIPTATGSSYTVNAATAANAGTYDVVITGECGTLTSSAATLTLKPVPAVPTITVNATNVNLLQSSAPAGNQWYLNNAPISGATNATYSVEAAGPYTVSVTQNGCTSTSAVHNFVPTAINEPAVWNGEVGVYPSPVAKTLYIKNTRGRALAITLYDSHGKKVQQSQVRTAQGQLDLQGLSRGVYQVVITDLNTHQAIRQSILKL